MTVTLITDKERYQGLSTDTKPAGADIGSEFFEEDTGKKFRMASSGWVAEAVEILGDGGYPLDDNHPMPVGGDSVYSKNIDIDGSDIGTFTGSITDMVDDLDTTITDSTVTNPKYFEIKLNRPVENSSMKFCSPETRNFSNVKIILKDRSGTTLTVVDYSGDNTKYSSNEYQYPLTAWCTARVEFHTADRVDINWNLIESSQLIHRTSKLVDINNSTETPLGIGATFTGQWVRTSNFVQAIVDVVTDQDSAVEGLRIELSNDASTVIHSHSFSILSNTPDGHHYPSELELVYYRIKYTNGAVAQTTFKLYTTLVDSMIEEGHVHNLDYALQDDHPAPTVRAVQTGKKPNGDYVNAGYTTAGNPKSSIEEYDDAVSPFRKDIEGNGIQTVGTTPVELVFTGTPTREITVTSLHTNSGYIYIGESSITSAGANSIDYLRPGERYAISFDDVTNPIYIVGSAAGQQYIAGAIL